MVQLRPVRDSAAAPSLPSSIRDPSVYHIQMPHPTLILFHFAQSSGAPLPAVSSSSIVVLAAGFSFRFGQYIVSALLPRACSVTATLPTSARGEG